MEVPAAIPEQAALRVRVAEGAEEFSRHDGGGQQGEHSSAAPAASITASSSMGPAPAPPQASSIIRPTTPISASRRHRSGS